MCRARPRPHGGVGYYGYRGGMYGGWPMYSNDVTTTHYKVGTGNIDVVDAARKQLVWEGVAEARLTDKMLDNPGPAIDSIVDRDVPQVSGTRRRRGGCTAGQVGPGAATTFRR